MTNDLFSKLLKKKIITNVFIGIWTMEDNVWIKYIYIMSINCSEYSQCKKNCSMAECASSSTLFSLIDE